jgi:hypothetical protein
LKSLADSAEEISEEQLHTAAGGTRDPNIQNIGLLIVTLGIACAVVAARSAAQGNADDY